MKEEVPSSCGISSFFFLPASFLLLLRHLFYSAHFSFSKKKNYRAALTRADIF